MTERELRDNAVALVERLTREIPAGARVVHCEAEVTQLPRMRRRVSEHDLHVLERAGDIVVFFDQRGSVVGWRDDGRLGTSVSVEADKESVFRSVVEELGLPEGTRMGRMEARQLPPVGWTIETVLFLNSVPDPADVVRVWVSPQTFRVIQCVYGALAAGMNR